ncbi:MAG: hypothetical protein R3F02_18075 [Thiolinea sp.]
MGIEGKLDISLYRGEPLKATIRSSRPHHVSQLFTGKPVTYLLQTIPLLFNVCGAAQSAAAISAVEQALQQPATSAIQQQRHIVVQLESLREQSWQWLLQVAAFSEQPGEKQALAKINTGLRQLGRSLNPHNKLFALHSETSIEPTQLAAQWHTVQTLLQQQLLGERNAKDWLAQSATDNLLSSSDNNSGHFLHWLAAQPWADAGQTTICSLPDTAERDATITARLQTEGSRFSAAPDWRGQPCEASFFTFIQNHPQIQELIQLRGNGLLSRCYGRLLGMLLLMEELEAWFCGDYSPHPRPFPPQIQNTNPTLSHIRAARGHLSHYLQLANDRQTVEQFHIIAPTEWNFHPEGVVAGSLRHLDQRYPETLERQAGLLIQALDPCVGYELTILAEADYHA